MRKNGKKKLLLGGVLGFTVLLTVALVALGNGGLGGVVLAAGDEPGADPEAQTMAVMGEATIKAAPDTVNLTLGVQSEADTASSAMDRCSSAMNTVIAALVGEGVPRANIQTNNLSLWPKYDYSEKGQGEIIGYQASNQVVLTWNRLDKVGDLIDAAVDAGANSVGGISFSLSDSDELYLQAVEAAVHDAYVKAQVMAGAAGVSVGGVVSMDLNSSYSGPIIMREVGGMSDSLAASVPVEAGQVEMRVSVRVEYGID